MGRLRKLASRVKHGLKDIVKEGGHPGTSPPHREHRQDRFEQPTAAVPDNPHSRPGGDVPWYLQDGDDVEGWDNTNAKQELLDERGE